MISNRRLLALLCSVLLSGWSSWALGNSGPKVITNATASVTDISSEAMSIRFSVPRDEIMQSTSRGAAARTKITRFVAIPECDGVALSFPPRFGEPTVGSGRLVQQKWRPEFGKVAGISRIRNQSIAVLELYPFAIADESGQPVASFDVQLRFQNPRGESFRDLGPMSNVLNSLLIHGRAQSVKRTSRANPSNVISHPFESGQVTWAVGSTPEAVTESAVDAHTDYLIVMADELSESLVEDLATRRATFNGLNVTVIKMSQIDSTPDDETTPITIRTVIKDVYDARCAAHASDSLLSHVLLLGDAVRPNGTVLLPTYYGFADEGGRNYEACDSYYSLLSEEDVDDDLFPDVFLGRIPADASSLNDPDWELNNVVSKILRYTQDGHAGRKALLVSGGNPDGLPDFVPFFGTLLNDLPSYVEADTLHRLVYPSDTSPYHGPQDLAFSKRVADKLNTDDYWLLAYFDHGTPFYCVESFYALHYDTLHTPNSLPLALLFGSDIGEFDLPSHNSEGYGCLSLGAVQPSLRTPTDSLDYCDVIPERLLLQRDGAIGALALSRSGAQIIGGIPFTSMFGAIFAGNAFSLGEILQATRMLMFPQSTDGSPSSFERNLTLFGDPALNVMWENGVALEDTVDLSISSLDIRPINAFRGKYVSNTSVDLAIGLRNKRPSTADTVEYEVWDGVPGVGTLKASSSIPELPGFNKVVWDTVTVSGLSNGTNRLYVVVDTTGYQEPTFKNNIASQTIHSYAYDFAPIALTDRTTQSITLTDLNNQVLGEEILVQGSDGLSCFSAGGDLLWRVASQFNAGQSDIVNGTPIVANIYKNAQPHTVFVDSLLYIVNGQGEKVDSLVLDADTYLGHADKGLAHSQWIAVLDIETEDDALEAVVVSKDWGDNTQKHVRAYSIDDHTKLWERGLGAILSGFDNPTIATGDIDADGSTEILVRLSGVDGIDSLYCIRSNGSLAWKAPGGTPNGGGHHDIALVPAGAEGLMDIITTANAIGPSATKLLRFSSDGSLSVLASENTNALPLPWPGLAPALISSTVSLFMTRDNRLSKYDALGTELGEFEFTSANTAIYAGPLLADVDGDDEAEIVVVSGPNNHFGGNDSRHVVAILNLDLSEALRFEFPFSYPGSAIFDFEGVYDSRAFGAPAIADIDDDGQVEMAFVSIDSVLHVIELGAGQQRGLWPQFRGNPMGTANLSQPVVGEYAEPVSLFNNVTIIGDAVFNEPLYVDGTASLSVSNEDVTEDGADASRVELIVNDEIRAVGSSAQLIEIAAGDGTSSSHDDWFGIFVTEDASPGSLFDHVHIRNAARALASRETMTITNSIIEQCSYFGVSFAGDSTNADTLFARGVIIHPDNDDAIGVNVLGKNAIVYLDSCVVDGCKNGVEVYTKAKLYTSYTTVKNSELSGIKVYGRAYANLAHTAVQTANVSALKVHDAGEVEASNSFFRTSDYGLDIGAHGGSPAGAAFVSCVFTFNDVGMRISDGGAITASGCQMTTNTTDGVLALAGSDVTISTSSIYGNENGIHVDDTTPAISESIINANGVGVYSDNNSVPTLRKDKVWNNAVGLLLVSDGIADIDACGGTCPSSCSNANSIKDNDYHIFNDNGYTQDAECNYWGGGFPPQSKFYGPVDVVPYLTSNPLPIAAQEGRLPREYSLLPSRPNPFNPTTTVSYDVPAPGGFVRIQVYNVSGQLVRTLVNVTRAAGHYEMVWDGSDNRGVPIASGVYFVRMTAQRFTATHKVVLLK